MAANCGFLATTHETRSSRDPDATRQTLSGTRTLDDDDDDDDAGAKFSPKVSLVTLLQIHLVRRIFKDTGVREYIASRISKGTDSGCFGSARQAHASLTMAENLLPCVLHELYMKKRKLYIYSIYDNSEIMMQYEWPSQTIFCILVETVPIPAGSPEVTYTTEDEVSPREGCRDFLEVIRRSKSSKGDLFLHTVPRNRQMKGRREREGGKIFVACPTLEELVVACVTLQA